MSLFHGHRGSRRLGLVFLIATLPLLAGDESPMPKPSSYAPAQDLAAQLELFLRQIEMELANDADYGEEAKERIARDANTLIVLAQVLANHDESHALRSAAPAIVTTAGKLAESTEEYAAAKAALADVRISFKSTKGGTVKWAGNAELGKLMKQVPILNNKLRSGVTGKRFEQLLDQNAGLASTLAAIAQVSVHDKSHCTGKEEESTWEKYCHNMRAAAAEIRTAIRKKDQTGASAVLEKMNLACDACHMDFRE